MKGIYLISYAVNGIKTLNQWAKLSFYKKTITKEFSIRNYNVKAIYGTNGAGKTAIVTSVKILKGIIIDMDYLNNPMTQKKLSELINTEQKSLQFEVEYLAFFEGERKLYCYELTIAEDRENHYVIKNEKLSCRKAYSHSDKMNCVFEVVDGEISALAIEKENTTILRERTKNLLSQMSLTAITFHTMGMSELVNKANHSLYYEMGIHFLLGTSLFAYLDNEDEHTDYVISSILKQPGITHDTELLKMIAAQMNKYGDLKPYSISAKAVVVPEKQYILFEKEIDQLSRFLKIFKHDLIGIKIDRKQDRDRFYCDLIMDYGQYSVHSEFESTGIKKLIKLFQYLRYAVNGEIVFIDEMDSNLHDVYLCALLEYMMEYGQGQLCLTTHNIGPMEVLKKNKKSIDFLSTDHKIYSWVSNGHYSPSNLYRNGMIEGSPFNVDSTDFLGTLEEDEE